MIIVSGILFVDPADRNQYLKSSISVMEEARKAPGCEGFALSPDPIEPDRINVYERWESDEDLERFRGEGPNADQAAQLRGAEVAKYRISSVEAP